MILKAAKSRKETNLLLCAFIAIGLLGISYQLFNYFSMKKIATATQNIFEHPLKVSNASLAIQVDIYKMHRDMKDLVLSQTTQERKRLAAEIDIHEQRVLKNLRAIEENILGQEGLILQKETRQLFLDWRPIRSEVMSLMDNHQTKEAIAITQGKGALHVIALEALALKLYNYAYQKATNFTTESQSDFEKLENATIVISLLFLLIFICIGYFVIYRISHFMSKNEHLTNILSMIRDINQLIVREKDLQTLIQKSCDILTSTGIYEQAWIVTYDDTKKVEYFATTDMKNANLFKEKLERGWTPYCIKKTEKENKFFSFIKDTTSECTHCPIAGIYNNKSAFTIQLKSNNKLYGQLTLSVEKKCIQNPEELSLLNEVAGDIAYGLYSIELEKALEENKDSFKALYENSEISIWSEDFTEVIKSLDGLRKEGITDIHQHLTQNSKLAQELAMKIKVIDVNNATLKLFNADSKEKLISCIGATFGDDAIEVFIEEIESIWKEEVSFSKEATFKTFDGKNIQGIITFQIPKKLNQFSNLSVSIIDITELKAVEKALINSNEALSKGEEKLRFLLNNLSVGVVVHAQDGSIIMSNPKASEMLGFSSEQLRGMEAVDVAWHFLDERQNILSPEEYPVHQIIRSKKEILNMTLAITQPSTHNLVWVLLNGFPVLDAENEIIEIIINFIDITELKKKDEMLVSQSRHAAMGEMIGMIAHQWRQPLSIISMDANNLLIDIGLDDFSETSAKAFAEDVLKQTQHLSSTIDDFRNFFKPDKAISQVRLGDLLDETYKIIKDSLSTHHIEFKKSYTSESEIDTYPRELMQVFVNIITNAKDALVEKYNNNAYIEVKVYEDDNFVITDIIDNGIGISQEILPKIFDPYFTTKDEKNGTGLGLYMSKLIIEDHLHGKIEALNLEQGTCFKIKLPK